MSTAKKRNANMELLRIISMLMVTVLHALGKSDLLVSFSGSVGVNGTAAWIFEALSIGAVNIFMLISGYFLVNSEFKIQKLIDIICQVLFYSVGSFLVFLIFGLVKPADITIYNLLNFFLPIHMEVYWFITAYVVLYILSPILSKGIKAVSQKTLGIVIICLLIYECGFKSILPFRLTSDTKGYTFLWYVVMFLVGAYFRLYGVPLIDGCLKGWILYGGGAVCVFAETLMISKIYGATGKLATIINLSTEYNNIFVALLAIGIFSAFVYMEPMNEKAGKIIRIVSPLALGVYLFQENLMLRFEWQKWFGLPDSIDDNPALFILRLLGAVLSMFVIGILVDAVRKLLFKGITILFKKLKKLIGGNSVPEDEIDEEGEEEEAEEKINRRNVDGNNADGGSDE